MSVSECAVKVQGNDSSQEFVGSTEICQKLSGIDMGFAWQLTPHDPHPLGLGEVFTCKLNPVSYTNANQGSSGIFTHRGSRGDTFL